MVTIDCPFCGGAASTDDALATFACDGCGVAIEVAPEPTAELEIAA